MLLVYLCLIVANTFFPVCAFQGRVYLYPGWSGTPCDSLAIMACAASDQENALYLRLFVIVRICVCVCRVSVYMCMITREARKEHEIHFEI